MRGNVGKDKRFLATMFAPILVCDFRTYDSGQPRQCVFGAAYVDFGTFAGKKPPAYDPWTAWHVHGGTMVKIAESRCSSGKSATASHPSTRFSD